MFREALPAAAPPLSPWLFPVAQLCVLSIPSSSSHRISLPYGLPEAEQPPLGRDVLQPVLPQALYIPEVKQQSRSSSSSGLLRLHTPSCPMRYYQGTNNSILLFGVDVLRAVLPYALHPRPNSPSSSFRQA